MRRASDVNAFSEFVEACAPSLFRTAYLMVGDHQLAQDLVQEALVKTLIAWPRLHDRANLAAYTRRIIVTTSISWRRRRSFHERPSDRLPERISDDPGETVATHDVVVAALLTVPPRQRAAIVLRYYQDLSEAQTAEVMGCSVGTVKSQVAAGLTKLRAALGPVFDETVPTEREVTS
ncbi:MAG TPA: SigE family RNA polymerase sigma factor [Nocardioides sp.]|uniref:SigE family RNA polymerase sigma factor n=1 Tax=uncultured Nocardioides sp. TaxID=198441 RepID=UPI000EE91564|nr:SigE family RNA polymerase sigma factor [uncultured Nocardioides sp.]HCB03717.1 SigE family RNA polymerase sigma factor [Nocardioides sp.]HRI95268.1 SigE family RNA polymerase sigma factor [Nocardioides sp.]HRK44901.1 SigE family RNA polymerase sigma factor [Nocardioides sp.]